MDLEEAAVKGAIEFTKQLAVEEPDQALHEAIDKGPMDRLEDEVDDPTEDLDRKAVTRTVRKK